MEKGKYIAPTGLSDSCLLTRRAVPCVDVAYPFRAYSPIYKADTIYPKEFNDKFSSFQIFGQYASSPEGAIISNDGYNPSQIKQSHQSLEKA